MAAILNTVVNAVHEMAHAIEYDHAAIHQACKDFRDSRTRGQTAKRLSELSGNPRYEPWEWAYEDEWQKRGGSHYAGRRYDDAPATEILTMGLERLCQDPLGFAAQDAEHFNFLIALIQPS